MPENVLESKAPRPPNEQENARLRAFITCTADAIIGFDIEGHITDWNAAAERMFGYTAAEAIGQTYTLIGAPEVYDFQHRVFSETIRGDVHQWYDTRRRRKDGTLLNVSITTSPLIIDGVIVGLVGIVRDITDKVQAAKELALRNSQLDTAVRQLAELNEQLQDAAEQKRRFVNMVLHDLRHPLTSMQTILYLLRNDEQEQSEMYLDGLESRVAALTHLLDELSDYHRIEAGRVPLILESVSVGAILRECLQNFTPLLVGSKIAVLCETDTGLEVTTDRGKLTHILLNLLSNALKFTVQGTISISGRGKDSDHWSLTIADTGIGMSPEVQSRVFEEFYQGMQTPSREGSGLGLSIARKLCDLLQGDLRMESAPGQGTCFQITFPRDLATR